MIDRAPKPALESLRHSRLSRASVALAAALLLPACTSRVADMAGGECEIVSIDGNTEAPAPFSYPLGDADADFENKYLRRIKPVVEIVQNEVGYFAKADRVPYNLGELAVFNDGSFGIFTIKDIGRVSVSPGCATTIEGPHGTDIQAIMLPTRSPN